MPKKIPTRIHLDADLLAWLQRNAKQCHCSVSQLVRTLIIEARKMVKRGDSK